MRNVYWNSMMATAFLGALLAISGPAQADDVKETEVFAASRGGQIYDNWMSALEAEKPKQTHPSYPSAGKQKGASTWRCKECHGWDYKGKDGAYSKGSHFTGIVGIRNWNGKDPAAVIKVIRNKTHGYTKAMISDPAAKKLGLFVATGQIEMDKYIDRKTKKAHGDVDRGARLYQTVCALCHGFDGKMINFADAPKVEYVGTVAASNPWEALHKIRNGQPGVPMVALTALNVQDQIDILAYAQTLPTK